jgi:hypothetical protein
VKAAKFILTMVLVAILSGCAATDMRLNKANFNPTTLNVPQMYAENYRGKRAENVLGNLLLEPFDSVGVRETPALLRGDVISFKVFFPEELRKEQSQPERITWLGLVVASGFEYLAQLIKRGPGNEAELLVDGNAKSLKDGKVIIFSTRATKAYSLLPSSIDQNGTQIDRERLTSDPGYRVSLVEKNGGLLSNFLKADYLISLIDTWNRFDTPRGFILTPLDEKRFREIVAINPGYTLSQRWAREDSGPVVISTDPIQMILVNGVVKTIRAKNLPTSGWDFDSKPMPQKKEMRP